VAERALHGVEEHQVTGLQLGGVDGLRGGGLLVAAPWQHPPGDLLVHRLDEAAAVQPAGLGRVAAPLVGHADETHGVYRQLAGACAQFAPGLLQPLHQAAVGQKSAQVVALRPGQGGQGQGQTQQEGRDSHGGVGWRRNWIGCRCRAFWS
jgi:hypothetical protein